MRALYIGHSTETSGALPYRGCHIAGARDSHLPAALVSLGCEVDVTTHPVKGPCDLLPNGVGQIPLGACDPREYDAVIVADYGGHHSLYGDWAAGRLAVRTGEEDGATCAPSFREAVLRHPCLVVLVDGHPQHPAYKSMIDLVSCASAVGSTTAPMSALWEKKFMGHYSFICTYGYTEVEQPENPYPRQDKPILFFCGRMMPQYIDPLVRLAESDTWEVWIASQFMEGEAPHSQNRFALPDEYKEGLLPGVHFASDIAPTIAPGLGYIGAGPVPRCDLWPFLWYADVGLNFVVQETPVLYCKIYDYLSAGLPVVTNAGAPNVGDVLSLQAGKVISSTRPLWQYSTVIKAELETKRDRELIRKGAQTLGGWEKQGASLLGAVREVLS